LDEVQRVLLRVKERRVRRLEGLPASGGLSGLGMRKGKERGVVSVREVFDFAGEDEELMFG